VIEEVRVFEGVVVRRARPDDLVGLVDVLVDCVEGGASVSFMLPFGRDRARAFWTEVLDRATDERIVLVAEDEHGDIVGTVQLLLIGIENQPHRGEVAKMLVHRRARRRGVGEALMRAAEDEAADAGRSLLVLDTASDVAERLYERLGWQRVGVIPDYALWPDGGLVPTTIFYKRIAVRSS
jgi:GNAT superfamily N-acetyltransferase